VPPSSPSTVRVALVYPDLLGTYGDSGNAVILAQRLRWRGQPAEVVEINAGGKVPSSCDLYVLGGGEDLPQSLAAADLNADRPLHRAVEAGAAILAVCAGLQVVGTSFVGPDGVDRAGLGLLDCATLRGRGPRAVGELVVEPTAEPSLPTLTGYENHGGVTRLGPCARPLGLVRSGIGNGSESGSDGAVHGKVWGTYMHGPVLARNPALADHLLTLVVGPLEPLDDTESEALRLERLRAARGQASAATPSRRAALLRAAGRVRSRS
jgi:lipid II isoglutaminyl synthase (glutamine-hydrolysing)